MFISLWNEFLYRPVFNFLIWIYNNWTDGNFGWAVVVLTISLRLLLLPFTLISERNKVRNAALTAEIANMDKTYPNDPVIKKEEIRKLLRKRKVQPWATAVVLFMQAMVLLLLYQVFIRGITGEKIIQFLYTPLVDYPGTINTNFYGFDLRMRHDVIWSGVVALWLFVEIYVDFKKNKQIKLEQKDLTYFIFFPLAVFAALWWLPMVKSLFILSSMIFSLIVAQISKVLFRPKKAASAASAHH